MDRVMKDGWMEDGCVDEGWMDGWRMCRGMDGWMMDRWMDGWMGPGHAPQRVSPSLLTSPAEAQTRPRAKHTSTGAVRHLATLRSSQSPPQGTHQTYSHRPAPRHVLGWGTSSITRNTPQMLLDTRTPASQRQRCCWMTSPPATTGTSAPPSREEQAQQGLAHAPPMDHLPLALGDPWVSLLGTGIH